jgi:hypothetical protein
MQDVSVVRGEGPLTETAILYTSHHGFIAPHPLIFQRVRSGPSEEGLHNEDLLRWHGKLLSQHLSGRLVVNGTAFQLFLNINDRLFPAKTLANLFSPFLP